MFPWDWPGLLKDAYQAVFEVMLKIIGVSINFDNLSIVQWLFSNGYGLGIALSIAIALIMIPAGILISKHRLSAVYAATMVLLSTVIGAAWFAGIELAGNLGDALTKAALYIGEEKVTQQSTPITLPSFTFGNPLFDSAMFAGLFTWSIGLTMLFVAYELVNIVLTFFGVITLYTYGLGPRTRRAMSAIISVLIVTEIIGRPIAIAIIKFGNWVASQIPTTDLFWVGIITVVSMQFALLIQFVLPFLLYKGVNAIVGKINGEIKGTVNSITRGRQKVDANVTNNIQTTMTNRARSVNAARDNPGFRNDVTKAATASAAGALTSLGVKAAKAAAMAGTKVHPALAVASIVGPPLIRAVGTQVANAPAKQKAALDVHR
jgi:hypothetical protein